MFNAKTINKLYSNFIARIVIAVIVRWAWRFSRSEVS
jgi:hypothetical protein